METCIPCAKEFDTIRGLRMHTTRIHGEKKTKKMPANGEANGHAEPPVASVRQRKAAQRSKPHGLPYCPSCGTHLGSFGLILEAK